LQVMAFPRNLRTGSPLRRIGRSGDNRLTPNQDHLMPDCSCTTWEYMVTISLCKNDEEAAYESYMNPEPGFQSGPGDSVDAD